MGNLNLAMRMVEKAKASGCDYIKMMKKNVNKFYSEDKLLSSYTSPYGYTWGEYRSVFEFEKEDYVRLDRKCKEIGIPWFATVQDSDSLDFMLEFDLPMYKVASINARNTELLKELADNVPHNKTIVISLGGSTLSEVEAILKIISRHRLYIMHCVSEYPCPPESARLGNIKVLQKHFASSRVSIGYSGHEEGYIPSIIAADMKVALIERHFCVSRHSFVHHIECALEPDEYAKLIHVVKNESNLKKYYVDYPKSAFQSEFGMSSIEKDFLINSSYGKKYIKHKTKFGK
jgi:N-acetylneuraminate synthase